MKRLIVRLLEWACMFTHWYPNGQCRLAFWSSELDERWGTDVWRRVG